MGWNVFVYYEWKRLDFKKGLYVLSANILVVAHLRIN